MSSLTNGWTTSVLTDLLAPLSDGRILHQGWSPQCESGPSPSDEIWGVLKTTSIQDGKFLSKHNKRLPQSLEPRPILEVKKGDILITCAGPRIRCGVPCFVRETRPNLIISGKMYRMRANEEVADPRFIESFLRTPEAQEEIDGMKTGMSESGMNLTHARFAKLELPIPPFNEQKRIADKLDQLLAAVDSCKTRLDTIPGIIKRFRQSVLAAATSGKLTEDWRERQPLQTSPYQGRLQVKSLPPVKGGLRGVGFDLVNNQDERSDVVLEDLPEGWEKLQIKDLIMEKPRNGYSPKSVEFETATRSLTLTATTSGRFNPSHSKYINETIPKESHLWLKPGDILIQRANTIEYVGVSAIYDISDGNFIYPDLMMKCRANESVLTQYLYYILSSQPVRSYFRENATGTAGNMPKINQQTVQTAPAVVPPIDEQQEIVRRVEALFVVADRLEARYQTARTQVDQLTPSLLAKAFRGELVPQDPNDEPAEKLLERIRAAQNATPVKRQKKRKKLLASPPLPKAPTSGDGRGLRGG